MRPALLAGSFVALIAALFVLWAHRFDRVPDSPVVRLGDLRHSAPAIPGFKWLGAGETTRIRISAERPIPLIAGRFSLPGIHAVEALHIRFRMTADQLVPGTNPWEDGRFIIEWHPNDPFSEVMKTPVGSIRFNSANRPDQFVILAPKGSATPTVRLENLGRSGSFELADLETSAVRQSRIWNLLKWPLIAGWLVWGYAFIRSWPQKHRVAAAAASAIWLLMVFHFAVPGPWQNQRAMVSDFKLGTIPPSATPTDATPVDLQIALGAIPSLAKLDGQGSWPLRIKMNIAKARPLLHVLLLGVPTLVLALLVGKRPALWLMVILALGIEASQVAFGYGFDWIDVFDLFTDGIGIALGLWTCGFLQQRFGKSSDFVLNPL